MQNKQPQISLVSTTHIYFSLMLPIACGLAATQFLFQYCLHSRTELKGWSPWEHVIVMEKREQWSNRTMVLEVFVLEEA